jgi:hypothetical protein
MLKNGLDKFLDKIISRKLLVWIISTVFMYTAKIQPDDWIMISMVYIGSQGALDIVDRYTKSKRQLTNNENINA